MRRFWWVPLALLAFFLLVQPRGNGQTVLVTPTAEQGVKVLAAGAASTPPDHHPAHAVSDAAPADHDREGRAVADYASRDANSTRDIDA